MLTVFAHVLLCDLAYGATPSLPRALTIADRMYDHVALVVVVAAFVLCGGGGGGQSHTDPHGAC